MTVEGLVGGALAPYQVRHDVALAEDVLERLATEHAGGVEQHASGHDLVNTSGKRTTLRTPPVNALRDLEHNETWLTLFGLQTSELFAELVPALRADLLAAGVAVRDLATNLICASPGGVTPAHMDTHDVLLLQVSGSKAFGTGSFDRRADRERELRRRFSPQRENLSRMPDQQQTWDLGPGDGVFVPAYTPHWARVTDGASIALSVTVRTHALDRQEAVHRADAAFCRRGLRLPAPGRAPVLDALRVKVVAAAARAR